MFGSGSTMIIMLVLFIAVFYFMIIRPENKKKKEALEGLKKKAELVEEDCYKFIDEDAKEVGYYNQNGDLIESRPAYSEEIQKTIFQVLRKNGTEDK